MPSPGFEARPYGIAVSVTNHYTGWVARSFRRKIISSNLFFATCYDNTKKQEDIGLYLILLLDVVQQNLICMVNVFKRTIAGVTIKRHSKWKNL
ncbi:hypothetical protein TNCV_4544211 [Trichonephila clavipes]|nr:hypothetical protein TNCV_4544211 [Trichonephila clavipes]